MPAGIFDNYVYTRQLAMAKVKILQGKNEIITSGQLESKMSK